MSYDIILVAIPPPRVIQIVVRHISSRRSISLQNVLTAIQHPPIAYSENVSRDEVQLQSAFLEKHGIQFFVKEKIITHKPAPEPKPVQSTTPIIPIASDPPVVKKTKYRKNLLFEIFKKSSIPLFMLCGIITLFMLLSQIRCPSLQWGNLGLVSSPNIIKTITTCRQAISDDPQNLPAWFALIAVTQPPESDTIIKTLNQRFGADVLSLKKLVDPYGTLTTISFNNDICRLEYHTADTIESDICRDVFSIARALSKHRDCHAISIYASIARGSGLLAYIHAEKFPRTFSDFIRTATISFSR
jgi:hypothetical protein